MKRSPSLIGLYQAVGLAAYIGAFAFIVSQIQAWTGAHPVAVHPAVGISLFLLTFIVSALTCGSIALARPAILFFDSRKREAAMIVFWNAVWLVAILAIAALAILAAR